MFGWIAGAESNLKLCENLRLTVNLSDRVVAAMKRVDRASYCHDRETAYEDRPQVIGYGQTISAPHVHALALKLLEPNLIGRPRNVLDVGSGSGYLSACFAEMLKGEEGGYVVGIDNSRGLVEWSLKNIERDGKKGLLQDPSDELAPGKRVGLTLAVGDGYEGYAAGGKYDAIHVGAAMEKIPTPLIDQLKPGGLLVGPVGPRSSQEFVLVEKLLDGTLSQRDITSVRYVPLTKGFPQGK